jgi:hypothetical protein
MPIYDKSIERSGGRRGRNRGGVQGDRGKLGQSGLYELENEWPAYLRSPSRVAFKAEWPQTAQIRQSKLVRRRCQASIHRS